MFPLEDLLIHIVRIFRVWGFGEVCGVIFGILLLRREPMTIDEISKETGYSKSSVFQGLNTLLKNYLVEKKKRDRKYVYWAKKEFLRVMMSQLKSRAEKEIKSLREKIEEKLREVDGGYKGKLSALMEEIKQAEKYIQEVSS